MCRLMFTCAHAVNNRSSVTFILVLALAYVSTTDFIVEDLEKFGCVYAHMLKIKCLDCLEDADLRKRKC